MTLSSTTSRLAFSGNSSTTAFSYPYYFLTSADLVVYSTVTATGVATPLALTTDYTVSGAGNPAGGTVTCLVAPATGTVLTVYRDVAKLQDLALVENDPLPVEELEKRYDKAMMIAQRLGDQASRAVSLPDGFTATFDTSLPDVLAANTVIAVNASGDGFAAGPTVTDLTTAVAAAAAAAASEAAAASSATSASGSATSATASATSASSSASSASTSASTATTQASAASSSASAASTSASSASTSATTATTQASNASTSASSASTSATTATTQASNASTSATNAATSATNAAASATAAAASAVSAAASAASVSNLIPVITGTRASPTSISAGVAIASGTSFKMTQFIQGNGGAVIMSANPQIAAGGTVGQRLTLIGRSATNTVQVADGTGLSLNGTFVMGADSVLEAEWDGTNWVEVSRREN